MSKLTCKELKHILPARYHNVIYKSGSKVHIDLGYFKDEVIESIRNRLDYWNIEMYREDLVALPTVYTVEYKLKGELK